MSQNDYICCFPQFSTWLLELQIVSDMRMLRGFTPSYILYKRAFMTYLLGGIFLPCKKDYKVMVF